MNVSCIQQHQQQQHVQLTHRTNQHKIQKTQLFLILVILTPHSPHRPAQPRHPSLLIDHFIPSKLRPLNQGKYNRFFLTDERGSDGGEGEYILGCDVVVCCCC